MCPRSHREAQTKEGKVSRSNITECPQAEALQ